MPEAEARLHLLEAANALDAVQRSATPATPPRTTPLSETAPAAPVSPAGGNCLDGIVAAPVPISATQPSARDRCGQPLLGLRPAACAAATQTQAAPPNLQHTASYRASGDCTDALLVDVDSLLRLGVAPTALEALGATPPPQESHSGDIAAKYLPRDSAGGGEERGSERGSRGGGTDGVCAAGEDGSVEGCTKAPGGLRSRAHAVGQGLFAGPLLWSVPGAPGSDSVGGATGEGPAAGDGGRLSRDKSRHEAFEASSEVLCTATCMCMGFWVCFVGYVVYTRRRVGGSLAAAGPCVHDHRLGGA